MNNAYKALILLGVVIATGGLPIAAIAQPSQTSIT